MQKNSSINFVHTLSKNSRFYVFQKNLWNCRIGNSPTHIQARTCAPTHTHATHTRTCAHNLKHTRTAWLNWLIFWFFGEKKLWMKKIHLSVLWLFLLEFFYSVILLEFMIFFSMFGRRLKFSCSRRLHNVTRPQM